MVLLKKNLVSVVKSTLKFKKIASIVAAILLTATLLGLIAIESPQVVRGSDENNKTKPNLIFKPESHKAVVLGDKKPEIVPGESLAQKEAREKAEAEAKIKAQTLIAAKSRSVVSRERRIYNDPTSFDGIYTAAGNAFGVDPMLLKAIHYVETGCSGSTTRSSHMGATGPMQFLPSTFARHGVDGNGDGFKDIHNVEDAIFSAANYLRACGYPNIQRALWGYNPSQSYYNKVIGVARSFGMII
ncbi:MAG: murein hydrolase B [bacterium ADurb.Bin212]|nr:MAG: murein hydrolase B [bacterium ADurb.Bin212]